MVMSYDERNGAEERYNDDTKSSQPSKGGRVERESTGKDERTNSEETTGMRKS